MSKFNSTAGASYGFATLLLVSCSSQSALTDAPPLPLPDALVVHVDAPQSNPDAYSITVDASTAAFDATDAEPNADATSSDAASADAAIASLDASPPDALIADAYIDQVDATPDAAPDAAVHYVARCGNGIVDPGEQCDDDNFDNFDSCSNKCVEAGPLRLVSVSSRGNQGDNSSYDSAISSDGRYVAFLSSANNLAAGATNYDEAYRHDNVTGATILVSANNDGVQSDNGAQSVSISSDGNSVAFMSYASNLTANANGNPQIYLRDVNAGTTTLVSADGDGNPSNDGSYGAIGMSSDARFIAFSSYSSNLTSSGSINNQQVFLRDMTLGTTTMVSVDSDGNQGNSYSQGASVSDDGQFVVFTTQATNLVSNDLNNNEDVVIRDTVNHISSFVGVNGNGVQGAYSTNGFISADGNVVVFSAQGASFGTNLGQQQNIFVRNLVTATTTLVSVNAGGTLSDAASDNASITDDDRFVVFQSNADNLVADDVNGISSNIFVRDLTTGEVDMVAVNASGVFDSGAYNPQISGDGSTVSFESNADDLVVGDVNRQDDVFIVTRASTVP